MGLWDDVEIEDFEPSAEEKNEYLENPDKGLELISRLLSYDKKYNYKRKTIKQLDYLLDRKVLESSGKVNISNELEMYDKLVVLSDKLHEQNKMNLLRNKSVVGIGGKFSAGKSRFINALIDNDILPEDQTPTTSIATYIVKERVDDVKAYTYNDQDISLDMDAAQALTHAFYKKYRLGFSQFINNLVINVPSFNYTNIALLDTPGYSKSDSGVKRNATDTVKAYTQLKTVDFLIWLVDIENGVIQERDIEFICTLKIINPILVVFNKADKKTENAIKQIIESSKDILRNSGLSIFDVIAYSAYDGEEYLTRGRIDDFMAIANNSTNRNDDIEKQILDIINNILCEFSCEKRKLIEKRNDIGDVIFCSEDVMEIRTLVQIYTELISNIDEVDKYTRAFKSTKRKVENLLGSIRSN